MRGKGKLKQTKSGRAYMSAFIDLISEKAIDAR
jgi:hypothetical protein